MNTAKKGRRKEHQVRDVFVDNGYIVTRAAGSKGPFDLVAIPEFCDHRAHGNWTFCDKCQVVLIQVKPGTIHLATRKELADFKKKIPATCRIEGWVVEDRKEPRCQFVL